MNGPINGVAGFIAAQYINRGIAHFQCNDFASAIACYQAALAYSPDDRYAHWNLAMALLSAGDYARGFFEHGWAWRLFDWPDYGPVRQDIDRLRALPVWDGERDLRVLAYHEMGNGDAIQVMRYLPELKRRADVTLVIDASLARLAQPFGIEVASRVPTDLSRFDARLPFFDTMALLKQTVETIPREPYIAANWQRRPGHVGIVWSGRTQKMFSLDDFLGHFNRRDFTLHSLQLGAASAGVEPLPEACDFADVAARIAQMEHIVCVDTAAVHLAGAMGHPSTHLVLPYLMDWRWWRTAAWYPAMKTYRQTEASDWATPFAQLNARLRDTA